VKELELTPAMMQLLFDGLRRDVLRPATTLVTRAPGFPARYRDSTGLAPLTTAQKQQLFVRNSLNELARPDSDRKLPAALGKLAALAGLRGDEHDKHALVFAKQAELLPAVAYAFAVRERWLCAPRALAIHWRMTECSQRKKGRSGVWWTHGKGAFYCEVQLMAEGRRPPRRNEEVREFQRCVVPLARCAVPFMPDMDPGELAAAVIGALLDVIDSAAALLRAAGNEGAASVLSDAIVTGSEIRFGAPTTKGDKELDISTNATRVWLGHEHPVWKALAARERHAVLALLPSLCPTERDRDGKLPGDLAHFRYQADLAYGARDGAELHALLETFAETSAHDQRRAADRIGLVPLSEEELRQANVDPSASWWVGRPGSLLLRSGGSAPAQTLRLLLRRLHDNVYAYAAPAIYTRTLAAADANEMHRGDDDPAFPWDICLSRQERRLVSAIQLNGHCADDRLDGAMGVVAMANIAFVALALAELEHPRRRNSPVTS
jgi:hypothetical protein